MSLLPEKPVKVLAWREYEVEDWDLPSYALIAMGESNGTVVYWRGPHIGAEVVECSSDLEDLGLDDCPVGLWVWEGRYVVETYYDTYECDTTPEGTFRKLTEQEIQALVEGRCPWTIEEWRKLAKEKA